MAKVIVIGDRISHGGTVTVGSDNVRSAKQGVARLGDLCVCAVHGPQPIVTASTKFMANGRFIARDGDKLACGATLLAQSDSVDLNA